MKLRNIFTALAAAALAFVGCQKESRFLDEVQVSKSVVTLPVEGGQDKITVTATDVWAIAVPDDAWFTVDKIAGVAGETVVTFSAEATTETREVNVSLVCAGAVQTIKVLQMAEKVEIPLSTCAEVNNNGVDGKVYRVKGTCTSIANTQYGNWYITDETGTVYIYGTLYNGATQQFTKLGLEVGDIVTVEGPRKNYNGTIELVDVTVIEIEKSLIKLEKMFSTPLPLEGGVATALLSVKSGEFSVEIPADATWLTAGEPTTIGGLTSVELTAAPNEGGARKTTVTFKTTVDGKDYIAMADIEQAGAIKAVTVAEFLAAAEGTALFELTGVVKNIKNTTYGNFDLVDATGSVYVYGLTGNATVGSNDKSFASLGINEGDKVTIVGTRGSYNGAAQVTGTAYLVSHVAAQAATVAEFLAAPVSSDKWYKLTGTIESIVKADYGNFYLQDASGKVYVYGLTSAPVAKNDKSFASLGLKAGDTVTLVGTRAQYASSSVADQKEQVGGPAYYVSHVAASTGGEGEGEGEGEGGDTPAADPYATNVTCTTVSSAYTDGVATVNGVANVFTLKLGTSKLNGTAKVTLPAGSKKVSFYAVGWKGTSATLKFSVAGTQVGTQAIKANDGATSNAPYTMTVTDSDRYSISFDAALAADTEVTVETTGSAYRAILFGIQAE
jgi:RPA family protein